MGIENAELLKAQLKAQYGEKTDLANFLSYDSKVKNIFGMRDTKHTIRVKVNNPTGSDVLIHFGDGNTIKAMYDYGLPEGIEFSQRTDKDGEDDPKVTIASLNREQDLRYIALETMFDPMFIRKFSFKSYQLSGSARIPDDSNYGNEITHYHLSSIEAELKKSTPLRLGDRERRSDVNTSVMTVDTIEKKFPAFMSRNDIFTVPVNAYTQLEITMHPAARLSMPELFYRQIMVALDVLGSGGASCACE